MNVKKTALLGQYVKNGLALIPIPAGSKAPRTKGWNLDENIVTTNEETKKINGKNIGLAHLQSRTCAFDIDDLEAARDYLSTKHIDIDDYLNADDAVQISSGRKNRAKLIYRLPNDIDPIDLVHIKADTNGFELRCVSKSGKTIQDVLPPSIHPDTGKAYRWKGDWKSMPTLPDEILTYWRGELENKSGSPEVAGGNIQEGERNDTIFRHACKLRAQGWEYKDARVSVLELANKCNPPLPNNEAIRCLSSAWNYKEGFRSNDVGNAKRLVFHHGEDIRYVYAWAKWLNWDGKRWLVDINGRTMKLAKDAAFKIYQEASDEKDDAKRQALSKWAIQTENAQRLSKMIELAKDELPIDPSQLDSDPMLLGCNNGVIDLRTGELRKGARSDYITKRAFVDFDAGAKCPKWISFLGTSHKDKDVISFLQRAIGYTLTGLTDEQCIFLLYGSGANGKSVLLNVLYDLLGDYAIQASASTLMVNKTNGGQANPDIARLFGTRFVATSEVEEGQRMAESLVKQMTGGDNLVARELYGSPFEFKPNFKIWLAANHKPIIRGDDYAIWRRVKFVPFEITIPEKKRDGQLTKKLQAELPGILNWAIEGCMKWQKDGLQTPKSVEAATEEYRADMDVLRQWIDDCCEIKPRARASAKKLYSSYEKWAEVNTGWSFKQGTFGRKLTGQGFTRKRTPQVVYVGICLKTQITKKEKKKSKFAS